MHYVFKLKTLITLILLIWVFILLAASFDNIWNSIECVINLDDIWRYLTIIWWYLTTETFTLEPENYRPKDIVKCRHLSPSGNRAGRMTSFKSMFDSHIFTKSYAFWFLNLPNQFSFRLCFGWQHLNSCFLLFISH